MRAYEKEETSRRKRAASGGISHSASTSNLGGLSGGHHSRRSKARPRLDTNESISSTTSPYVGNPQSGGISSISPAASSMNLSNSSINTGAKLTSLMRPPTGAVRFDAAAGQQARSRAGSEAPSVDEGGVPAAPSQSPGSSSLRIPIPERITTSTSSGSAPGASGSSSTSGPRVNFNAGGSVRVQDEHISAQQFAFLGDSKLLFSCGHWDHSCRITHAETGNLVQSVRQHRDVITCLALAKDFGQHWLVTGSRDCTLMIWDVTPERELPLNAQPQYILYGHDDAVTCVAINPELDVVVSGSDDGTVIIHNLRDGSYVRSIVDTGRSYANFSKGMPSVPEAGIAEDSGLTAEHTDASGRRRSLRPSSSAISMAGSPTHAASSSSGPAALRKVTWVGLSKEAYVVTYSADEQLLCTYSLNGLLIASRAVPEALYAFMLSEDGKVLLTGGSSCLVVFRWVSCALSFYYY